LVLFDVTGTTENFQYLKYSEPTAALTTSIHTGNLSMSVQTTLFHLKQQWLTG